MSSDPPAPRPVSFRAGDVLAGRYRLVDVVGRGARGEVWSADDLVLHMPVALKLIRPASATERATILREVRLAREITHPAVCRIFDVGEESGLIHYSMELVRGEDLGTLLRRAGRLPSETVIDIGDQLCGGLAMAHATGVLHLHLKPANVLMHEDGSVRITDFGLAGTRDDKDAESRVPGTDYRAPEQRVPGGEVSEKTDLYALGLILYELLTGAHPFAVGGAPATAVRPSALVPDVSPQVERVVLQALSLAPERRPQSAAEMAESLVLLPTIPRAGKRSSWRAALAVVTALVAVAAGSSWLVPRGARALTEQDTLVLADFDNTTGEPVFDGALKVALAVALEQSPFLRVFPDDRLHDTLRLMERDPNERVTIALGREVAQREQLKALVAGSIRPLGSHYVVTIEAINAPTGDVMASEQREVATKEEVLGALGAATSKLRERLGESLASIQRFDVPLPRATTASLEALHAYALALDQGRVLPRVEAIPPLRRAIELDPNFAMAQALLSGVYANTGRTAEAPVYSRRAFDLRDRVSERERFFISWRYYIDAAQAWDKALELAQSWTTTYPREAFAFNSLGLASAAFGQHEQAVRAFTEAIRLDPRFVPPHGNRAGSLIALDRFADARTQLDAAAQLGIDFVSVRRMGYLLAFVAGNQAGMAHELDLLKASPDAMWSSIWDARTSAYGGRVRRSHALYRTGVEAALAADLPELAAQWTMEDAETHAIAGQCDQARGEVASGVALRRDNFTLERASRTLALCGDAGAAQTLSSEIQEAFPDATLTRRVQLPLTAAASALRRGDAAGTVELLDPLKPYDRAPSAEFWSLYLRGGAYLALRNPDAAKEQFSTILQHRGLAPTSPLYPLAYLGAARAAVLAGDPGAARMALDRLLTVWAEADPDIAGMTEARGEYARLR